MRVIIPFKEDFRETMLAGSKTATSRTKRYAWHGDTFEAFGASFVIASVSLLALKWIAQDHFQEEGFASPDEFKSCWGKIHPHKGYVPDQLVYFHRFIRVAKHES